MPKIVFKPSATELEVEPSTKVLLAARRAKVDIRFGCAACRCGTCGVAVAGGELSPMREDERALLTRMALPVDGTVRLACQARVMSGEVAVDLAFQETYSPDQGDESEDDDGEEEEGEEEEESEAEADGVE
jgi:ferredoxin